MTRNFSLAAVALASAVLLSACGGGGGDSDIVFENEDPEASEQSGSVVVAGADPAALNGVYANDAVYLNAVEKVNPIGSDPELCRYRFSRLDQAGTARSMTGDIRYQPGTPTVRVMFISINDTEYTLNEPVGASVDRTNDEVDFAGARLTSRSGDVITLTGSIPMRDDRPEGC
ncbi:MAG: hypothetical protein EOO21_04435 [Comamonadaceae bacterium]|nr:MAG: hypothetical protein EOO21_04435 [Comamonadaceae bacterium]